MYIYIYTHICIRQAALDKGCRPISPISLSAPGFLFPVCFYIPQRVVQWKQGVVIYMMLYTSL